MSLTKDDVNLLRGHAEFLRMEGKTDMPAAFDRLALTIERHIAARQSVDLTQEAVAEAMKRWPEAQTAIMFMASAIGSLAPITADDIAWADAEIATPQPPKPAGNAIDGLLATARPFLAEEMLLKQGYTWSGSGWVAPAPKPAGDPCAVCKGAGSVGGLLRAPSGDPQDDYEGEVACTACDGSGIKPAGAAPEDS